MGHVPSCQPEIWDTSPLPLKLRLWDNSYMAKLRPPPDDAAFIARELYRRMMEVDPPLTQKRLATLAELNPTYVRDILVGKSRNPKSEHLQKLAKALGCDQSDLTDPGRPGGEEHESEATDRFSERAIVEMWRVLSPQGKELMFRRIAELLHRRDIISPPIPRKG